MEATDKMLERVRALIAKAESTDSPAEAEALFERAEQLMTKHMIDEAMLEATRPAEARMAPEVITIDICAKSHLDDQFTDLAMYLASHFGCRIIFTGLGIKWMTKITARVYGYGSALRSFEMLYTGLHLDLASQLTPKPDPKLGFDENVYILHEAGVKWQEIARMMNKTYDDYLASGDYSTAGWKPELMRAWRKAVRPSKTQPDVLVPWPDGHRLINAYKRHCKAIGDTPRAIQSPVTFQRNFAQGYVYRINHRLHEMKRKEEQSSGAGTALVLRQEAVDEMYAEHNPDATVFKGRRDVRYNGEARQAGDEAGQRADLGQRRTGATKRGELS